MDTQPVTVRIFGSLRVACEEQGLPHTFPVEVPAVGISARELAISLNLAPELIEGVFVNHTVYRLSVTVHPGDRIAFVPHDTPGPHRFFLGLYSAGRDDERA